jgi:hypothetical protein
MAPFTDFANFTSSYDGVLVGFLDDVKARTCQRVSSSSVKVSVFWTTQWHNYFSEVGRWRVEDVTGTGTGGAAGTAGGRTGVEGTARADNGVGRGTVGCN